MNCDQAIELLPWLLNGTLGEDERREVRGHLTTCASCRQALAGTRRAWEIFDQHIPAAALVAYAAGGAAGERTEGVDPALLEEHLAACPECAAELELVRMSRGLAEDDAIAVLTPRTAAPARQTERHRETAAPIRPVKRWRAAALAAGLAGAVALGGWYQTAEHARALDARLAAAGMPPPVASAPPALQPEAGIRGGSGGGQQTDELRAQMESMKKTVEEAQASEKQAREQLAELETTAAAPLANTWVGYARGDVVRGGNPQNAEPDVVIPASAPLATLLLHAGEEAQGDRDLEILDAGGRAVWKAPGLHLNADSHDYSITLRPGTVKRGDYTVRLYRHDGGKRTPAESYTVRIQ
jgi:anti-sigma factor RsiW